MDYTTHNAIVECREKAKVGAYWRGVLASSVVWFAVLLFVSVLLGEKIVKLAEIIV